MCNRKSIVNWRLSVLLEFCADLLLKDLQLELLLDIANRDCNFILDLVPTYYQISFGEPTYPTNCFDYDIFASG